jgi:hypothetical protein
MDGDGIADSRVSILSPDANVPIMALSVFMSVSMCKGKR